ncbi:hypothetical protein IHE44_0006888 [Lamprotornis superbus]|uniref:Uncharacterized protein n=1 Tax=Lamprotornis superbus TaxID=245042 RepID=A0A835NUT6_9PASS|nr:hypothetical protein IHE44_0006888 [Lamprotornis superbus]
MLRTRREDRPRKAGFPDEPMREYMLYLQRLEQRSEEQFLEHWLNPHCLPHCNRDLTLLTAALCKCAHSCGGTVE